MPKTEINLSKDKSTNDRPIVSCISCEKETNHIVLASIEEKGSEVHKQSFSFDWLNVYQIVQCQGCNNISFRKIHTNSEDCDHEYVDNEGNFETIWNELEELYPNRASGRETIKDDHMLPISIQQIYKETLSALNTSHLILAGIGIRAIIESVCKGNSTSGALDNRIDQLVTQGVLSEDGAKTLHKLRVLGNVAAHEVKPHSRDQLNLAFDVIEHLLNGVYIFPIHANDKLE